MSARNRLAVAYCRVSSSEQEESGYSIPAQKNLIIEYARKNHFTISAWFIEAKSGKPGSARKEYTRMLAHLAKHRSIKVVLCEKADRFSRSLSDAEVVEQRNLELHLIRDRLIITPDAPTTQHLQHELSVVIARNYLRTLRAEIIKGMTAKAEAGLWPSAAPTGYRNVSGRERSLVPDARTAPIIMALFQRAGSGTYSARQLTQWAREQGLTTSRGGRVSKNSVLHILRNRIYIGQVTWKGRTFDGTHEALVSPVLFARVQEAMGEPKSKARHVFPFNGIIKCGACKGLLSSDRKTKRRVLPDGTFTERFYTYLHCNGAGGCGRKHYREEFFNDAIGALLRGMEIDGEVSAWLQSELAAAQVEQVESTAAEVQRLRQQRGQLEGLQEGAYVKMANGDLDESLWKRFTSKWQEEIDAIDVRLETVAATPTISVFAAAARKPIELLQRAPTLWLTRDPAQKAQLAKLLLIELEVADGSVRPVWRSPFGELAAGAASGEWWS